MIYDSIRMLVVLCFLLVASVGIIILQMSLSKKENKWFGRILPSLSFIISLMPAVSNTISLLNLEMGVGVEKTLFSPQLALAYTIAFLFLNIPTAILFAIYMVCRTKHNKIRALEKMSIQDLE